LKPSLKNIADTLKLSKTTVSWVLSGVGDEKGISKETQERVFKYAREINYEPNLLARGLNTGISGTIGLILPSISDSFYSRVAREVEKAAEESGYSLMIGSSDSLIEKEDRMIRLFKAKQVDGIILAPTKISKRETERLIEERYPFVLFDRYFHELDTNYIIIDNEESSYELVSHILKKGFRKIAVITTNPHLRTLNMRREGYARALMEAGVPVDFNLYGEVAYANYEENLFRVLDQIFEKVPDVDGFFFTTHILALEAFNYFFERGIDINSGKYGLACIHDVPSFKVLAPKMNIARMPIEDIGKNAVRMLMNAINGKMTGRPLATEALVLPCELLYKGE